MERCLGPEHGPLGVMAHLLVPIPDQRLGVGQAIQRTVANQDQRICRQVVEQGHGPVEEQGQVVLDSGRQLRIGNVAIDRTAARLDGEGLAEALAKMPNRGLVERELAGRQDADPLVLGVGNLRLGVEQPQ